MADAPRLTMPIAAAWTAITGMDERLRGDGYARDLAVSLCILAAEVSGELPIGGEWDVSGEAVGHVIEAWHEVEAEVGRG